MEEDNEMNGSWLPSTPPAAASGGVAFAIGGGEPAASEKLRRCEEEGRRVEKRIFRGREREKEKVDVAAEKKREARSAALIGEARLSVNAFVNTPHPQAIQLYLLYLFQRI